MTTTSVTLSGFVYDNAGNAVQDATVTAYTSADNATSANGLSDTTDANGRWDLTTTDETKYPMDVKVVFGSSTRWIKAANGINLTRLTVSGDAVFGENDTGVDVTMYGATSGRYLLWDQSEDALHLNDSTELKIGTLAAGDMVLYHDGTNSYIKNATGALKIATESSGIAVTIGHTTSEVTIGENLTVTGDLTVSGDTITVSTSTVAIEDSLLLLAKNQGTSADAVDFGIYGKYGVGGTAKYAGIFRDLSATNDPWTFFDGLENEPGTTVNTSGTNYALAAVTAAEIVGTTIDASTDFTIGSTIITDGVITDSSGLQLAANMDINGTVDISSTLTLGTVVNADADVDKFLVLDSSGNVDFRTGANVLSDIGATGATALDDIGTGDAATTLATTVGNITIDAQATDADVVIKVDDNGTPVTAVTFDGSDEGNAVFVNDIQLNSDGALLEFGADQDTVLTHTDGTGLTLNSTNKLTFGDTDSYVHQSTDGTLRIDGEAIIDLNASTRVDVSGDLKVGTSLQTATIDFTDGDLAMTIADGGGVTFAQAVDLGSNTLTTTGSLQVRTIDYSDGDVAMTIADGGGVTFSAGFDVGSDASGDILYHNGTSYVRLAKGSDNEVLTLTSGIPAWEASTVGDITNVIAGAGMTGGATTGEATLNVIGGTGITANADDIAIDSTVTTLTGSQTLTNKTLTAPTLTTPALGTPASGVMTNVSGTAASLTAGVATVATTVTITDNENTDEANAVIFTAGGDVDGGNLGLESDGDLTYNPSTGTITAAGFTAADDGVVTLANEGKVKFTDTTFSDGNQRSSGITFRFTTSSLAIAIGQAVHLSGTTVILADADVGSQGAMPCIGVAASATTGSGTENIDVLVLGCMRYDTYDFTVGSDVFVTATAGGLDETAPSTDGHYVQKVGIAISADILYVNPSLDVIEHAG